MKATPQTIEKFNKAVIEALWRMPYEDAIFNENPRQELVFKENGYEPDYFKQVSNPITLSRVMQVLKNKKIFWTPVCGEFIINTKLDWLFANWELTINNQTATSEDQSEECLNKLLELIK